MKMHPLLLFLGCIPLWDLLDTGPFVDIVFICLGRTSKFSIYICNTKQFRIDSSLQSQMSPIAPQSLLKVFESIKNLSLFSKGEATFFVYILKWTVNLFSFSIVKFINISIGILKVFGQSLNGDNLENTDLQIL